MKKNPKKPTETDYWKAQSLSVIREKIILFLFKLPVLQLKHVKIAGFPLITVGKSQIFKQTVLQNF